MASLIIAQLRAPLYEDKVVDFLFGKAEVTEREVTKDELQAAIEAEDTHVHGPDCGHDHDHKPAAKKKAPAKKAAAKEEAAPAEDKPAAKKPAAKKAAAAPEAEDAPVKKALAKKPAAKKAPAAKG
jgi:trigger factor